MSWSRGYLVRRFTRQVGLTPKTAARVLRFRRATEMLAGGTVSLAGLVAACGYYGQAHLSRELLALAGITPGRLPTATRPVEEAVALWCEVTFVQARPLPTRLRSPVRCRSSPRRSRPEARRGGTRAAT
ncbi:AraC family transcriptional regulator [Streptomyces sp. 2132.2]|uniref:helix-turn-helix domain-containing protein n=1 Tax=Streptomyces sp. 2132.2 TaxID=2485161 RepID=UPI0021A7E005|nr:AraC family transcriptional regulator [Streptomyces sp. 2132.2]